jgi:hypothetical protein
MFRHDIKTSYRFGKSFVIVRHTMSTFGMTRNPRFRGYYRQIQLIVSHVSVLEQTVRVSFQLEHAWSKKFFYYQVLM